MDKETLEEAAKRIYGSDESKDVEYYAFINGAKWQAEKSQSIIPFDAYDIEVFAVKPNEEDNLFAYIGYKVTNGNFHFSVVPFTEPQQEKIYTEEDMFEFSQWVSHNDWVYLPSKGYWVNEEQEELEQKLTTKKLFGQFKKK
jgi:hypothetical protein